MANEIHESTVKLTASDGFALSAFRATPRQGSRGGLVVLQEIFGLTDQMKGVVRSYARDGYDTIFPCFFDRVAPNTVVPFDQADRGRELAGKLALDKVIVDLDAAVRCVQGPHGVSVLGFCWGGGVIVPAAAKLDLRGAIAFYGTRLQTFLDQPVKCPLLFHFGTKDQHSPPEVIAAVGKAFPSSERYSYDTGHAFANDARPTYVPAAAETARARTLAFLAKNHQRAAAA
jgi:carboxymethylenebutenolidase